jgi:hypothetical protein
LAALATQLDEASPPLTAADVVAHRVKPAPVRRKPFLVAAGASLAVAAAVAGFAVLVGDEPPARVDTAGRPSPAPPAETTVTTEDPAGSFPMTFRKVDTPPLLLWDGREMALVDYSGKERSRAPMGSWSTNQPDVGVDLVSSGRGVGPADAVALDDPIPGCGTPHGRGGIVAAACGGPFGEGPTEIRVAGADGKGARRLAPARSGTGHWRYALPSPDGKWVLGQWSGECEAPSAFLINVASGRVEDVAPAAVDSYGIGWAPDGRAIVGIGAGPCADAGFTDTGTFLVDPNRNVRTRLHPFSAGTMVRWALQVAYNRLERRVDRALDELGLEVGSGESSHGGEVSNFSMIFEGAEIFIHAVPESYAGYLEPVQPEQLRFRCGNDIYTLDDDLDRPNRARVERAAARLVSRLYCTRRPA